MELFIDALKDTLEMAPVLLAILFAIEFFEHKYGNKVNNKVKRAGKLGPLIGAFFGIIPQCGISVLAASLYAQGSITLGTMLSVFIATSDEAIPVMMSTPGAAKQILPLIAWKFFLAVLLGSVIDLIFKGKKLYMNPQTEAEICACETDCDVSQDQHGCFELFLCTLRRTLRILSCVFFITLLINFLLSFRGIESMASGSSKMPVVQVLVTSLIGLIPNCATSVGLMEVFFRNTITFGALVAGLVSNAGVALIVLFKEVTDKKRAALITALLYVCGACCGLIVTALSILTI